MHRFQLIGIRWNQFKTRLTSVAYFDNPLLITVHLGTHIAPLRYT